MGATLREALAARAGGRAREAALVVDDVPHQLETGETARFSGLSAHHCTTQDSPAVARTIVSHPGD